MELGLNGKVALVTGASRGIGQGIALSLADEGCDLLLTGRDEAALAEVAARVKAKGRKAAIVVLDLRRPGAEKRWSRRCAREFGRLDILVNNAGATQRGDFFKLTDADWADGFALKFFAHVRLTREAWPLLQGSSAARWSPSPASAARSRRRRSPSAARSTPPASPSPRRWPTSARPTACRSIPSIRAASRPSGCGGASARHEAHRARRGRGARRYRQEFGISRFGKVEDIGSLIAFLASSHGRWLHGATIDIDGGEVRSV